MAIAALRKWGKCIRDDRDRERGKYQGI